MITTTELIELLKKNEIGGISKRPREISVIINGKLFIGNPTISISGTGDGICGPEIYLDIDGNYEEVNIDKVNICGIPHTVIECADNFDVDAHFGQIDYKTCEIRVNEDMTKEAKEETICHEMIHGILVHLGYSEQSQDETFVQALANAIYQGFDIRVE